MAITTYKKTRKFRTRSIDGGAPSTSYRDDTTTVTRLADKAVGAFITFADGSKFRRATSYSRSVTWTEPQSGENTQTIRYYTGRKGYERTSEGGFQADIQFGGNMCYVILAGVANNLNSPPQFQSSMRNECETKALLDLANSKANIGENLATLSQTIRLVKDPLSTLLKELKNVHANRSLRPFFRKAFRDIYRDGKAGDWAAQEYLKYVYGWKPLMQDIYGIMELAKAAGKRPLLLHAVGRSNRMQGLTDRVYRNVSTSQDSKCTSITAKSKAICNVWAQPDPNYRGTRTLNQLGLLNPASLAWELVPASFVVDWVLPIGPVLQALTATAGLSFVDGSTSQRVSGRWVFTQGYYGQSGYGVTNLSPSSGLSAYEGYNRTALSGWPRPGFWFDPDPLRLSSDGSDRIFKFLALSILALPRG